MTFSRNTQPPLLVQLGISQSSELQLQTEDFWNRLEVRFDRILTNVEHENYILSQLQKHDPTFVRAILDWAGIEWTIPDVTHLAPLFHTRNTEMWVKVLFLLQEFCDDRRYESFRTAAQELLTPQQFASIDGKFSVMASNRLLIAWRVFCDDPEKLKFLIFWHDIDNRTFERYSLVPSIQSENSEDGEAPLTTQEIEDLIRTGVDLNLITQSIVEQILSDLQGGVSSNRQMICLGVLPMDGGSTCWVFIRRVYRESHITEVERIVFADEAEFLMIQFRNRISEINIKYERKDFALEVAAKIASHFLNDTPVEYVLMNETTSGDAIRQLLDSLLVRTDTVNETSDLELMEIDSTNLPLEGAPRIIVRGNKMMGSIATTLQFLESQYGLDLLGDIENLNGLKLIYTLPNQSSKRYIVTVYLQQLPVDNRYFVTYSTRSSMNDRTAFEEYMLRQYDIRIVPRNESQTS